MELRKTKTLKRSLGLAIGFALISFITKAQFPYAIGNLQAGDTLEIIYDTGVKSFGPGVTQISNQVSLSGSNFSTLLSDDPDLPGAADATITEAVLPVGDLQVLGNKIEIADGSVLPNTADSTSFGLIKLGQPLTVNYYIKNTGFDTLRLDSIKVESYNAAVTSFTLTEPASGFGSAPYDTLSEGDSLLVAITFSPLFVCPDTAKVTIYSSDLDEGEYDFLIAGEGFDLTVTSTADDGCGSLRYILANAMPGDTIKFSPGIDGDTIKLASTIVLSQAQFILGNGRENTIISGENVTGVFSTTPGAGRVLYGLSVLNGSSTNGGGLYADGETTVINSSIRGNKASTSGGGIYVAASGGGLAMFNTEITGNTAPDGGGIENQGFSGASIYNSTIAGNAANGNGGGINNNGSMILHNSIVAKNENLTPGSPDIYDSRADPLLDFGNNLIGDTTGAVSGTFDTSTLLGGGTAPAFDPLFQHPAPAALGLPTSAGNYQLSFCSPAIDSGSNDIHLFPLISDWMTLDLNQNTRNFDMGIIDIGAYEYQGTPSAATVIFVDSAATGGPNSGTDWANAFTDFQDALDAAACSGIDTIFVAKGSYYPSDSAGLEPTDPRAATFMLPDSVVIFGGFNPATGADSLHERDWTNHETILSGDIQLEGDCTDNVYHVVTSVDLSDKAILDGFTIYHGYADGLGNKQGVGGGLILYAKDRAFNNMQVLNCTFDFNFAVNQGGGAYVEASIGKTINARFDHNIFVFNEALFDGGGFQATAFVGSNYTEVTNCTFIDNLANSGAAMHIFANDLGEASLMVKHSNFSDNWADTDGGAMSNYVFNGLSNTVVDSCEFTENIALDGRGGAIFSIANENAVNNLKISNTTFKLNEAGLDWAGGAIDIEAESVNAVNNTKVFKCIFDTNSATYGGAIANNAWEGTMNSEISQSVFYGNVADNSGAIDNYTVDGEINTKIQNNTITQNESIDGSTIETIVDGVGNTSVNIVNSIVYQNVNGATNGAVYFDSSEDSLINSLVSNLSCDSLLGGVCVNSIFGIDPLFTDAINLDFTLQECSFAINTGTTDTVGLGLGLTDLANLNRVFGGRIDMGAYEYQAAKVAPPVTAAASASIICPGEPVILTADCGANTITWYDTLSGGLPIGIGNNLSVMPTDTTVYYATCSDANCESVPLATDSVKVYPKPSTPTAVTLDQNAICLGTTIQLSGSCETGETLTWKDGNGAIVGSGSPLYLVPSASETYYASCELNGCFGDSLLAGEVIVSEPGVSSVLTLQSPVCGAGAIPFEIAGEFSNPEGTTYQWQIAEDGVTFTDLVNGAQFDHVTDDTLMLVAFDPTLNWHYVRLVASNTCGTYSSDHFYLDLREPVSIVSEPTDEKVCPGNVTAFSAVADGTANTYQWQVNAGSGFVNVTGSNYSGQNSPDLILTKIPQGWNGYQYQCVITNDCNSETTVSVNLEVSTDIVILSQPVDRTVCEGDSVGFIAAAFKTIPGTIAYQWQRKSGTSWVDINTGGIYVVNDSALSIINAPLGLNNAQYRCVMDDFCQTLPKNLTVTPVAHVTSNPSNVELCVGNNAQFTITAAGLGLSYRWQVNTGSGFVNLTDGGIYQGATSATLQLNAPTAAVDGYTYRCVVSGTSSCDLVADTSGVATISIAPSAEAQTIFWNSPISTDDGVTQAVSYILGINTILQPNGKAEYRAGNAILLNPGFEVEAGAVFKAKIQNPCQTTTTSSSGGKIPKELVK